MWVKGQNEGCCEDFVISGQVLSIVGKQLAKTDMTSMARLCVKESDIQSMQTCTVSGILSKMSKHGGQLASWKQ